MVVSEYVRRPTVRLVSVAAFIACGSAFAPTSVCRADDAHFFSADVELAPIQIDGVFPVVVQTTGGALNATLDVDTDVRGKLKGTVYVNDLALGLGGTATRTPTGVKVVFTASTFGAKLKFAGEVADGSTSLTGTCTGKGFLAAGKNPFTIDLSSSQPLTATIEFSTTQDAKGRIKGRARVQACGDAVDLVVSGKVKSSVLSLALKQGKSFTFKGTGAAPAGNGDATLDWNVKGFGGFGSGTSLVFVSAGLPDPIDYPLFSNEFEIDRAIPTIIPTAGTWPRGKISISPPLPAGLTLDPTTGVISGTPTQVVPERDYTVSAGNFAATYTASFRFATRIPRSRSFAPETKFLVDADYQHFLNRAEFGIRQLGGGQTTLDRIKTMGLDAYVDSILQFRTDGPAEAVAAPELINPGDPVALRGKFPSPTQLARWWSSLLINTDNPFQERLAFFWCDHFAVSADALTVGEAHFMQEYVNLFRYGGNGNFKTLLLQMSKSGAMLKFLNGNTNVAGNINENFAREFWELFTLGVDNGYTQSDIVQGSHAFTGYKFVTDATTTLVTPQFDPTLHDANGKAVLGVQIAGQSAADDYESMVNVTLAYEGRVGRFIATKLFEHFAFESPHPDLVTQMGAALEADWELGPFLKTLLKSEAFFSADARNALVKSPIDYGVGFIHTTGLKLTPASFQNLMSILGQAPTQPPSVNGWPLGTMWFSAQGMSDRANFLDACVNDTARQTAAGINVANILPPPGQRSAAQVVDRVIALFGLVLQTGERQRLIDFVGAGFDGSTQAQIDDKVRGLLYIAAQHPQFEIR